MSMGVNNIRIGRQIKISADRVGIANDFLYVADDYFVRPAQQDYWRIDAADDGNYVISRLITDEYGNPQVDETVVKTAARVTHRESPTQPDAYISIALSPTDEILLLDESHNTYILDDAMKADPYNRFSSKTVEEVIQSIAQNKARMMDDLNDERWSTEWTAFTQHLANFGPIPLDEEDLDFKSLMDLNRSLSRVVG